jgi:hypothetical protein
MEAEEIARNDLKNILFNNILLYCSQGEEVADG